MEETLSWGITNELSLSAEYSRQEGLHLSETDSRITSAVDEILSIHIFWERPIEIEILMRRVLNCFEDEESRVKIAKKIWLISGRRVAEYFDIFNIHDESSKIEIALICIHNHPRRTSKHLKNFGILDQDSLYRIALLWSFVDPLGMVEFIENYWIESSNLRKRIFANWLRTNPSILPLINQFLPELQTVELTNNPNVDDIISWINNTKDIAWWSQNSANIFIPVKRRDVGVRILSYYIENAENPDSREVVKKMTLFPIEHLIDGTKSEFLISEFYDILLEIQSKILSPVCRLIKISPDVFKHKSNIDSLLNIFRDISLLLQLKWTGSFFYYPLLIKKLIKTGNQNDDVLEINTDSIDLLKESLYHEFNEALEEVFKRSGTEFDIKNIYDLKEKWNWDIRALLTLFARYSGRIDWRPAVPVLMDIVSRITSNTLIDYKYSSDEVSTESSEWQLAWLSPSQIEAWRNNAYFIDTVVDDKNIDEDRIIKETKITLTRIRQDLETLGKTYQLNAELVATSDKGLIKFLKENFQDQISRFDYLLYLILESNSLSEIKWYISRLTSLKDVLWIDAEFLRQINHCKAEINKLFVKKPIKLLFTTFFDHPKLVLEIWTIVKTPSCYSYLIGTEAQAIVAALIDWNIKAIASFVIWDSDFKSRSDYLSCVNAINNWSCTCSLSESWNLIINASGKFIEIALSDAYYRQIVKIWKLSDDEWFWIRGEQAYSQTHKHSDIIQKRVDDLIANVAKDIGSFTDRSIIIPNSKSPCPTYSDLAGWRQTWSYIIP